MSHDIPTLSNVYVKMKCLRKNEMFTPKIVTTLPPRPEKIETFFIRILCIQCTHDGYVLQLYV